MTKKIRYVASCHHIKPNQRLPSAKIGVTGNQADYRIRQLNSTKMPIQVELVGAWTFVGAPVSAEDAEKAAHYLLSPYNVNGEWFEDPDEDLADRVGKFVERLGGKAAGSDDADLKELNTKRSKALANMQKIFKPMAAELEKHGINWEYMTWKVGMDSPYGRLNISVPKTGDLSLRMRCSAYSAAQLSQRTALDWKPGVENIVLAKSSPSELLDFVTSEGRAEHDRTTGP